jgi:hypothetical protein
MILTVYGHKLDLVTMAVALVLGLIIGGFALCSCTQITVKKEAFNTMGAPIGSTMSGGVPGDIFDTHASTIATSQNQSMYAPLANNVGGPIPLPEGEMLIFQDNDFKPECCHMPQQYSSSTGCACISVDQMKFLNSRGGNNTIPA